MTQVDAAGIAAAAAGRPPVRFSASRMMCRSAAASSWSRFSGFGGGALAHNVAERAQVEAVLADGTIIDSLKPFIKNNTGYDLKQLFIGSEGTLGIITRAVLRLHPPPGAVTTTLAALPSYAAVVALLIAIGVVAFDQARIAADRIDEYVTNEDPFTGQTGAELDIDGLQAWLDE